MVIKDKDFIEIEYTGSYKADGTVFDTTDKKIAQEEDIYNENATYGPKIVCIGEKNIIKGIDDFLKGKEPGIYELDVKPEDAFGKKDPKLLKIVPTKAFTSNEIKPFPGLQVNIDGMIGVIKTVSGGRTIVDFNHPLAGHELHYKIKVNKIIEDDDLKLKTCLQVMLGEKEPRYENKDGIVEVRFKQEMPAEASKLIADKIKSLVPSVKDVKFVKG
ncbi:hypothetical protein DRJ17_04240 [Candidatus Woesearchaeota archaeon]|nr:MAG: hypothetical protein DRJ17_04240 [Candidatus Woesearchaeota archaeon]